MFYKNLIKNEIYFRLILKHSFIMVFFSQCLGMSFHITISQIRKTIFLDYVE